MTRRAECRAGHEGDTGFIYEPLAELDVGCRTFGVQGAFDARKNVERPVGRHAVESRQRAYAGVALVDLPGGHHPTDIAAAAAADAPLAVP